MPQPAFRLPLLITFQEVSKAVAVMHKEIARRERTRTSEDRSSAVEERSGRTSQAGHSRSTFAGAGSQAASP
jgi:hypothetical protein